MSDLKPCPFCGGEARKDEADDGGKFIECSTCSACTALHYDRAENLESAWNSRRGAGALERGGSAVTAEKVVMVRESTYRDLREALGNLTRSANSLALANVSNTQGGVIWYHIRTARAALAKAEGRT